MPQPQTPAQGGAKSHLEPSDCQGSLLQRRLEQGGKQRKGPGQPQVARGSTEGHQPRASSVQSSGPCAEPTAARLGKAQCSPGASGPLPQEAVEKGQRQP